MTDETLFAAALDQPDPAARAAYLDSACPDPDTRRRLDALLAAHDRAGEFLNRPAVERPATESAPTRAYAPEADHTRTHGGTVETDTDEALGFLAPARRPDSLGRIGHYEVLEVLGRGGFGIVFRAFDEMLQRVVAVKALAPSMAATSPARKRFVREARHAGNVRHENVVQIHDISRDEERLPYLVMEFIPGETLQERLDRTGPLEVAEVVRIGRQIATGLAAAHEMGLVHRDIKPSNILIESGPEARIKITDFGLARAADDASISQSGVVAGTPMYMAPEQAKGDSLDHRADLFSLGSVLYVMCSGRPPFRASGTLAVLKRVVEEEPRPIREIIPEVPDWLCRIIAKLHAKDPAERYQTAKEVADVLADCEAQLKTSAELMDLSRIPAGKTIPVEPAPPYAWAKVAWLTFTAICVGIVVSLIVRSIAPEFYDKYNHSMEGAAAYAVFCSVLIVFVFYRTRRQLAAKAVAGVPIRALPPRWIPVAFALGLLLFAGAILYGRAAVLYVANRGEMEIAANDGFNSVIVVRNDRGVYDDNELKPLVTDWMTMKSSQTLKLPPGTYQLNAGIGPVPGRKVIHWKVMRSGTFGSRTEMLPGLGHVGWSVIVTVERGERLSIWPVVEDLAAVEKRNRDATDPSKLDAIARAVNELDSGGFVPLFNGKDLTGWTPSPNNPGQWRVEDGALVGRGPGYLFSAKSYDNFHLRVEAKVNAAGNSGVSFGQRYQIEIRNDARCPTGSMLEFKPDKTPSIIRNPDTPPAPDTWFTLEIRVTGGTVAVRINGGAWRSQPGLRRPEDIPSGSLELEALDAKTVARFRKIEIKELPPGPPPSGQQIAGWGTSIDPKGDCKFELGAGGLTITVPGGHHNLNPTPAFNDLSAPRVLRRTGNDFQLEVLINPFPVPEHRSGVNGGISYVGAGLLVWQDERSFVRFLRAANGDSRRVFVTVEHFREGRPLAGKLIDIPDLPTLLRIERRGSDLHFYYSTDMNQPTELKAMAPARVGGEVEAGIAAVNSTRNPFTPRFSRFLLQPADAASTFTPLFNGKDTTGWSGKFPNAWSVEDGVLTGRGKNGSAEGWSELIHPRNDFGDFHLRAQARMSAKGWASIRVRKQKDSLKGYKIWLSNDPEKTGARTGRLDVDRGADDLVIANPPDDLRLGVDEWFTLELLARGPELVLSINGKEATRVSDPSFAKGEIQLEVAGAETVVQFRKIEVRELPPTPDQQAREEAARLNGEWVVRLGKLDGHELAAGDLGKVAGAYLRIVGGEFEVRHEDDRRAPFRGAYEVDAAKKELLFHFKGRKDPVRCTYRFEGGRLALDFPAGRGGDPESALLEVPFAPAAADGVRNLKQLAIGMSSYHDAYRGLPRAGFSEPPAKGGKPLLSWRVAILPFIEELDLYRQFHLDEPWDSEHNKKLIERMPKLFEVPGVKAKPGMTHYRVFVGPGTAFEPLPDRLHGVRRDEMRDGPENTLMIVEAAEPTVWTKPDDLPFDPKKPLPRLEVGGRVRVVMCDGSVRTLSSDATEETLRGLITHSGRDIITDPFVKSEPPQGKPLYLELERRPAPPPATKEPDPAALQPLRDLVAATARSRDLVKARFEAGTASKIDLLAAEADVVEARIRLAESEANRDELVGLCEVLVAHRQEERDLVALRVNAGADAPNALNKADARLADAQVRLAKLKPPAPAAPAPRPKK